MGNLCEFKRKTKGQTSCEDGEKRENHSLSSHVVERDGDRGYLFRKRESSQCLEKQIQVLGNIQNNEKEIKRRKSTKYTFF